MPRDELYGQCPTCTNAIPRCTCRPSPTAQGPEEGACDDYRDCPSCGDLEEHQQNCTPSAKAGAVSGALRRVAHSIRAYDTRMLDHDKDLAERDARLVEQVAELLRSTPVPVGLTEEQREALEAGETVLMETGHRHVYRDGKTYSRAECIEMARVLQALRSTPAPDVQGAIACAKGES